MPEALRRYLHVQAWVLCGLVVVVLTLSATIATLVVKLYRAYEVMESVKYELGELRILNGIQTATDNEHKAIETERLYRYREEYRPKGTKPK